MCGIFVACGLCAFIKFVKAVVHGAVFNRKNTTALFFTPARCSTINPFAKFFGNFQCAGRKVLRFCNPATKLCNFNKAVHNFMHCVPWNPGICLIASFKLIKLKFWLRRIFHCGTKNKTRCRAAIATTCLLTFIKTPYYRRKALS